MGAPVLLERAFELAKSGTVRSPDDIRRRLTAEGYSNVESHLASPSLRKQLNDRYTSALIHVLAPHLLHGQGGDINQKRIDAFKADAEEARIRARL